jgi:ornithine lipid ester-linked acyl 2-hydroxylase
MSIWYSLFDREKYKGTEPFFYDSEKLSFSSIITSNYQIIKHELFEYLQQNDLPNYFNSTMVQKQNSWQTISLRTWKVNLYQNYTSFPKTLSVINKVPGLVSASFTLLKPNGKIVPHCGDTNAIYRCHLGLKIPSDLPHCGFKVGTETKSWEEGELLIFTDAHEHEAFNNTNEDRLLFLFDIVKDEHLHKKQWICATVLTSLFLQQCAEKFNFLYKIPMFLSKIIAYCLVPLAYIAIPVRNFIHKLKN